MVLLDAILEKSLLHWMLHSSTDQRDEDIIRTLTSVDFCWLQRITRRRFKKRIWKQLKGKCISSSIASIQLLAKQEETCFMNDTHLVLEVLMFRSITYLYYDS